MRLVRRGTKDDQEPPRRMSIEFVDRHGEHADGREALCDHGRCDLYPGDVFKGKAQWGSETVMEVEVHYAERGKLRVIVNHIDYMIARAKQLR